MTLPLIPRLYVGFERTGRTPCLQQTGLRPKVSSAKNQDWLRAKPRQVHQRPAAETLVGQLISIANISNSRP